MLENFLSLQQKNQEEKGVNKMLELFYSLVTGLVYVSGKIRQQEINNYAKQWTDLIVTYELGNVVTQHLVTYVNADGTKLYEEYVDRGNKPRDPVALGLIETPTLASTAQYDFTYTGWDNLNDVVLADTTITALFLRTGRRGRRSQHGL